MVKFNKYDFKRWEEFRLSKKSTISRQEFEMVCQFHAGLKPQFAIGESLFSGQIAVWPRLLPQLASFFMYVFGIDFGRGRGRTDPIGSEHIIRQRSHPFITLPCCCLHVVCLLHTQTTTKTISRQQQIVPEPIPGTHVLLLLLLWATPSSSIIVRRADHLHEPFVCILYVCARRNIETCKI